jgi:alpha,alpha-trehalase
VITARADHPLSPADLFGPLLAEVQLRRLFPDGKSFVDAVPRRAVGEILSAFETLEPGDHDLHAFVQEHFELPAPAQVHSAHGETDVRQYIRSLWPELIRESHQSPAHASLLPLDAPYLVPGGRFVELYYWDSYFSLLGLVRDGHEALARSMVDGFTDLIERYGHIPNGTRSYYLSRSQPPLYFAMIQLIPDTQPRINQRRLHALLAEHHYWMAGADTLRPGESLARVAALPDGAVLNRYWDGRDTPRDESLHEDVATVAASGRSASLVYRALRAGAESGWDFSSRWLDEGGTLASIRTTDIIPIDLNAFLYGLEQTIVQLADMLCDDDVGRQYRRLAKRRRSAMHRWLWSDEGFFTDFDLRTVERRRHPTAASLAPLFTGAATQAQAASVARIVSDRLLAPGGLRTTLVETGEQWDWPNGWAPLQWIAFAGLRRYGHTDLARRMAHRWIDTVETEFQRSGWLHEKYDVERRTEGAGGEYPPQLGFGWTNGVTAALIDLVGRSSPGRSER